MKKSPVYLVIATVLGASAMASTALAQQQAPAAKGPSLEMRVQRIERLIENQILREMLDRLEQIQNETRELRGELESHNHRIDGLKRRQRELYIDVDRRLHTIERGGLLTPAPATSSAQGPAAPATSAGSTAPSKPGAKAQSVSKPAAPTTGVEEQNGYEKAFNLLREGRYEQAQSAFQGFLTKFPDGRYAANAQYWLGEVFYLRRDFDKALEEFNKVVKDHPDSPKRANALLKIGFVNYEKGDWKAARSALESVVRDHKGHSAARLAANRLNQMTQEGH